MITAVTRCTVSKLRMGAILTAMLSFIVCPSFRLRSSLGVVAYCISSFFCNSCRCRPLGTEGAHNMSHNAWGQREHATYHTMLGDRESTQHVTQCLGTEGARNMSHNAWTERAHNVSHASVQQQIILLVQWVNMSSLMLQSCRIIISNTGRYKALYIIFIYITVFFIHRGCMHYLCMYKYI